MAGLLDLIANSLAMKEARKRAKEQNTLSQLRINLNAYLNPDSPQEQKDALANIDTLSGEMLGGQHKEEHRGIMHGLHSLGDAMLGAFGMQLPQGKLPTTPGGLESGATAAQGGLQPLITSRVAGYDMGPSASTLAGGGGGGGATPATLTNRAAPGWPPSTPGLAALQSIDPLGGAPGMTPRSAPSGGPAPAGLRALGQVNPFAGTPGSPAVPTTQGLNALQAINALAGAPAMARARAAEQQQAVGGAPQAAGAAGAPGIPINRATPASLASVPIPAAQPPAAQAAPAPPGAGPVNQRGTVIPMPSRGPAVPPGIAGAGAPAIGVPGGANQRGAVMPLPSRVPAVPPDMTGAVTPLPGVPGGADQRGSLLPLTQRNLTRGRLAELMAEGKLGGAAGQQIQNYIDSQLALAQSGYISLPEAMANIKGAAMSRKGATGAGGRTEIPLIYPDGSEVTLEQDRNGVFYDPAGNVVTPPPNAKFAPKKTGAGKEFTGAMGSDIQAAEIRLRQQNDLLPPEQRKTPEQIHKLAEQQGGALYEAGQQAQTTGKMINTEVNARLAEQAGVSVSPEWTAAGQQQQGTLPGGPPPPEKGQAITDNENSAAINAFISRSLGMGGQMSRGPIGTLLYQRGMEALEKQTGLGPEGLNASIQLHKDEAKALDQNVQMAAGLQTLQDKLTMFGQLMEDIRGKVDDTGSPLLNKYLNDGMRNVTGNPDLAALDTAVNAVARTYGQVLAGGFQSKAMPPVQSQEEAKQIIGSWMTRGQVSAVVGQIKKEAAGEVKVYAKRQRDLYDELARPIGERPKAPDEEPSGGGGAGAGGGDGGGKTSGGAKRMRAPDGSGEMMVPANKVDQMKAWGAVEVQ